MLKSGQSFAISGLLDKRTTDMYAKTPGICERADSRAAVQVQERESLEDGADRDCDADVVDPLTDGPFPPKPKPVIPTLEPQVFDKTLPAGH